VLEVALRHAESSRVRWYCRSSVKLLSIVYNIMGVRNSRKRNNGRNMWFEESGFIAIGMQRDGHNMCSAGGQHRHGLG